MKTLSVVLTILALVSLSFAQNTAEATQTGNENDAIISQDGSLQEAYVTQNGNLNDASATQEGTGNVTYAEQLDGDNNNATINQDGGSNEAYVAQGMIENYYSDPRYNPSSAMTANQNSSTITQIGNLNLGDVIQVGDNNNTGVTQSGNSNTAYSYQGWPFGFWGETAITSALSVTNSSVTIDQTSDGNVGAVWQYGGDNDHVTINQNGLNNISQIVQGFIYEDKPYDFTNPIYNVNDNNASVTQAGSNNVGKAMQLGDGNSFTLNQNGDGNILGYNSGASGLLEPRNAYFEQDGDGNIFIGTQTDGATLDHTSRQTGDDNDIDMNQGMDDYATIIQEGNLNTANLTQDGGAHTADIQQWGNSNTANVTQQQ